MRRDPWLIVIAVAITAIVITAVVIAVQLPSPSGSPPPPASYPTEPFPALWQSNFTGTPMTAMFSNGTVFALTYGNTTSSPPPFGPDYPWNVLAINASTGLLSWSHQIFVSNEGNSIPQLVTYHGEVYFIQWGDEIAVDSINISTGPALFAVGFNPVTGAQLSVPSIPTSAAFFFGSFELSGDVAYLGWPVWNGSESAMTVEAVRLLGAEPATTIWKSSFPDGGQNSNLAEFRVSDQYVVVPFGELWVLDGQTGALLYGTNFTALGEEENVDNGVLLGSRYYFAYDGKGGSGQTPITDLIGYNLTLRSIDLNETVVTGVPGSIPTPVNTLSGMLTVTIETFSASGGGSTFFVVFTPQGGLVWSSAGRGFSDGSGNGPIGLGYPRGVLGGGDWLLTSVSGPSSSNSVATQYFEEVDASNGTLLWTHSFSFYSPSNTSDRMLYPPNAMGSPSVVLLATEGNNVAYRWAGSIGYAIL